MTEFEHEWAAPATEGPERKPEARFGAFSKDERECLHLAVTQQAKRILDDAMADVFPAEFHDSAAGTFLLLANLARQLDLIAGRPTTNADGALVVAAMIASGEAPQMADEDDADDRDYSGERG